MLNLDCIKNTIFVFCCLIAAAGIAETNEESIQENQSLNYVHVSYPMSHHVADVSVIVKNKGGKVVHSSYYPAEKEHFTIKLDLSHLENGLYTLTTEENGYQGAIKKLYIK